MSLIFNEKGCDIFDEPASPGYKLIWIALQLFSIYILRIIKALQLMSYFQHLKMINFQEIIITGTWTD